jgi:molecular chaperone GrpE
MTNEEKHPEVTEEAAEQEAAETVVEGAGVEQTAEGEELQLQLEDARAKVDEHWEQILRLQAELDNTRRRAERDVENAHKYGLERFANELLPVKDSLELGLQAANAGEEGAVEKLREGTELTLKMLNAAMEKFGLKEVNPVGEPFDPQLHQAMTMQESKEHAPNTVVAVMQKGYLLNDRLIRPAMVMVAKESSGEPGGKVDEKA